MSLGGGTFETQNKIIPGAYINFVAANRASLALSDRGVATMPLRLDWGVHGEVFEVTSEDFQRNSLAIFGYEFTHPSLAGVRDLFRNIRIGYFYRVNADTSSTFAVSEIGRARHVGTRGNDIAVTVESSPDEARTLIVSTLLGENVVHVQGVTENSQPADNDFVTFNSRVSQSSWYNFSGGQTPDVVRTEGYVNYLNKIESYNFNVIGYSGVDSDIMTLFANFTRRMREDSGVKFQCVLSPGSLNPTSVATTGGSSFDHEGIVSVVNSVEEDMYEGNIISKNLVFWTTGLCAGLAINQTGTNRVYSGEFTPICDFTQSMFEGFVRLGHLAFYRLNSGEVRILSDINSLVNLNQNQSEDFKYNQTIRTIDQIGNDMALLFTTRYKGIMPNDQDGRIGLWSDIVMHADRLQNIRAIQEFSPEHVTVEQGENPRSVVVGHSVKIVNAMSFLYMTTKIN